MINLHDIRYVRLGTRDLASAEHYATTVLGLQVARREGKALYLRSDSRDHTLCYFEGDPSDHTTAFEVEDAGAFDAAAATLEANDFRINVGTAAECEQRHVRRFLSFKDPTGNKIDLVLAPHHSGQRYFPARDVKITGFSHVGLRTTDPKRDEAFWTTLCSAKVSDWIGEAPLLRIDDIHHKIALFPSTYAGIQHINHQVESIDELMRAYYILREKNIAIRFGPGRHPTSGAMFLYFEGTDGLTFEYSTGVRMITQEDESTYVPRQFPFLPESFCQWGARADIPEFKR